MASFLSSAAADRDRRPAAARRLLIAIWLVSMPILSLLYMAVPPSPDQSQFDYMAWLSTQGRPFYAGSFDMNWPGKMLLHEAGIRLFGVHSWTWRLTDFILMQLASVMIALFLRRARFAVAPLIFLAVFPPLYVSATGWMAGQRDIVATGFLLAACGLAAPPRRPAGGQLLLAGMLVGYAVVIRPTFLSFLAGLLLLEALPFGSRPWLLRLRRVAALALGSVLIFAASALYGLGMGNLDDWHQQAIQFSLTVYSDHTARALWPTLASWILGSWHWIAALALLGLVMWIRRDRLIYELFLVLGVAATSLVSYVAQGKGFGYHLGGLLTVFVVLLAVGIDQVAMHWRAARSQGAFAALVLVVALPVAGTMKKLTNLEPVARILSGHGGDPAALFGPGQETRMLVEAISAGSAPDDPVLVYGARHEVPYLAERLPSHRFTNALAFDQMDARFPHHDRWIAEFEAALRKNPPVFVLIGGAPAVQAAIGASRGLVADRPMLGRVLKLLEEGYAVVAVSPEALLMRRTRE